VKIYEFKIMPRSGFGTPIVGDTLFGHLCWQLSYDPSLAGHSLDELLSDYSSNPFVVMSNAYPHFDHEGQVTYAFRRPDMPLSFLFSASVSDPVEMIRERKKLKARKWMLLGESFLSQGFNDDTFVDDKELFRRSALKSPEGKFVVEFSQTRNKINRLTGTTGEGGFAPFNVVQNVYAPGATLTIFAGIDTSRVSIESVSKALQRIGKTGYGRDASTGLGRFDVMGYSEVNFGCPDGANACYTLGPSLPGETKWQETFFIPIIRFGRHGGGLAGSRNPFKSPVRMVREGAVYMASAGNLPTLPYIGAAITGVSIADARTVVQGYALFIPFKLEVAQ
jgi:CRISPR-associated protein Csm4